MYCRSGSNTTVAVRAPRCSVAYWAPAAACALSPKQARNSQFGTSLVSLGEVAPLVTNGTPARAAMGAAASTWSVSERPMMAEQPEATRLAAARWTSVSLVWPSRSRSSTRRPISPPRALIRSTARRAPLSDGASSGAWPPEML